jgi:hypothetical protein
VHAWREWRREQSVAAIPAESRHWRMDVIAFVEMVATFTFVSLGWVLFRADSLSEALDIYGRLLGGWLDVGTWRVLGPTLQAHAGWLLLAASFVTVEWLGRERWNPIAWERLSGPLRWIGYTALVWTVVLWGTRRSSEFIYFQF